MSSQPKALSIDSLRRLSTAGKVNATGLILSAAGMLLQIVGGSTLYPTVTGPIVLLVTAAIVAFVVGRWTPYIGLVVPLVLGVGAIVAAAMSGGLVDQLTDPGRTGVFLGSVLHVIGLIAAVGGGVGMVAESRGTATGER